MDFELFERLAHDAMRSSHAIVAFVSCEVSYSGRAETFLERGDRILLVKPDRSVLIHQPSGSVPVNYMKGGSELSLERGEGRIVLHAAHKAERAWLDVSVFAVHGALSQRLEDAQRLDLAGNERDMSDWIRDNPRCIGEGFRPIAREEQTDVGFIDVFGHDGSGTLVVVECKRVTASLSAVDQLRRYVERVKRARGTQQVRGVLAAPAITPNALEMLASLGFAFCRVDPPKRLERWARDQKRLGEF